MARIRTIKPKFWDDIKIGKLSRDARLLYIGMWNFCDDLGVIIADSIWLKSKIFPFDQIQLQQFERFCAELQKLGFISLFSYKNEKFYYLPKFRNHQVINRPNYEDINIPKDILARELNQINEQSLNDHGLIIEQSVPIEDKEKDIYNTPYNPPKGNCELEIEFEKFRKLYPGVKRGLSTEFGNLKTKHKDWESVIPMLSNAIINEINFHKRKSENGEFVPQYKHLSTWINNRCWEQEFEKELKNETRSESTTVYRRGHKSAQSN